MLQHCAAAIVIALLLAGCDGLFGPLDAPAVDGLADGATPDGGGGGGDGGQNVTPDGGTDDTLEKWSRAQCGGGDSAGCSGADDVCMNGLCGPLVALDAGDNTMCAVQDTNLGLQVICWGFSQNVYDPLEQTGGRGWGVITDAIDPAESFYDIAVGSTFACVLVESERGVGARLLQRCWGEFPTGRPQSDLAAPFWGGVIDLDFSAEPAAPNVSAGGLTTCVSASFDSYGAPAGVCWGVDESASFGGQHTTFDSAMAALTAGGGRELAPPYLLEPGDGVICGSASGSVEPDVDCSGAVGDTIFGEVSPSGLGPHDELAVSRDIVCIIKPEMVGNEQVICRGWADPAVPSAFPMGSLAAFDEPTVTDWDDISVTVESEICARRKNSENRDVIDCYFKAARQERQTFDNIPDFYGAIPNALCGVVKEDDSEFYCWGSLGWPGLTFEPSAP